MTQNELRNILIERLEREKQCYICKVTGIDKNTLSLFKTGRLAELYPNTDLDHVTGLDLVGRNVDLLAIDGEVSVAHQLTSVAAGLSKAQAEHDVVQTALHDLEQVLTGLAGASLSTQVSIVELLLQNAVDKLDLLLLLQLRCVLRLLLADIAVGVAGGILLCIAHDRRRNAQGLATLCDRLRILCHNSVSSFDQTRRRFGGRQPLWGMGVTSLMRVTSRPVACSARIADSRPAPGPLT